MVGVSLTSFSSNLVAGNIHMPNYVEQELVSICRSAAQDKSLKMTQSIKGIRLNYKVVALKVVCNDKDIISFAEHHGAKKTVAKLSHSIGKVNLTDLAFINHKKHRVTFDY